jgi:4-nitrophenyl phosphatase
MLLSRYSAVLFDMDGVLYRGSMRLPGVPELLTFFDAHGIRYACATNNSTLTPEQYETKLAGMGIAIPAERIITSSVATRRYLEQRAPRGTHIYYIGMDGLRKALFDDGYFVYDEQAPEYVVTGADFELTYAKARTACLRIRAGAQWIGTNPDTTFPSEEGIIPGAGALLALLRVATETEPYVIGKPGPAMFQTAVYALGIDPAQTLTIGDRLDTDIAGARAAGLAGALVLTGISTADSLKTSDVQPDAVFADLPALLDAWRAA